MENEHNLLWKTIKKQKVPSEFYLTSYKTELFKTHQKAINDLMPALHNAVKCADREHMVMISSEIGNQLDMLISVFGNFELETTASITF